MTRIIVSTIQREVLQSEISGWLYVIDLETRTVLRKTSGIEPPYRERDTNPRGGMRGMRGISIQNGELAVANFSSIFFFDPQWNLLRTFTHPLVSAIHEILYVEDGIWVTSTANDLLAKFDISGSLAACWHIRAQKELINQLVGTVRKSRGAPSGKIDYRNRAYFNSEKDDRTHLNSISTKGDGSLLLALGLLVGDYFEFLMAIKTLMLKLRIWDMFLAFNRVFRKIFRLPKLLLSELAVQPVKGKSAIVRFDPSQSWQVILQLPVAHNPSHSVRVLRNGNGIFLDTSNGAVVSFNLNGNILSRSQVSEGFLRGLLELSDGRVVIGSGGTLIIYDLDENKILDQLVLSKQPLNTIFDLQVLPPEFELPPESLEGKNGRMIGYDGVQVLWSK